MNKLVEIFVRISLAAEEGPGFFKPLIPRQDSEGSCDPVAATSTGGCGAGDIQNLIIRSFNLLLALTIAAATISILVGGIILLTSGGSQNRISKGRNALTASAIGIAIVLLAWVAIYIFFDVFIGCEGRWYYFNGLKCT